MILEDAQSLRFAELPSADQIFGCTPGMQEVRTRIEAAVGGAFPVLIEGEIGTGKEVVAQYLHLHSKRDSGPFVRVNCAAMPARMLEGELFGSEQGNGDATSHQRAGSFGMASSGTLFLDEIVEMDIALQRKLVQVFNTGRYGDRMESAVSARVICSSSVNLQKAILDGRAIEPLLSCFGHRVSLLPLRERKQDIPGLCEYLIAKFARNFGRPAPRLASYMLQGLKEMEWSGNIRELENWIARIVIFGTEETIGLALRSKGGSGGVTGRRHRGLRGLGESMRRRRGSPRGASPATGDQ